MRNAELKTDAGLKGFGLGISLVLVLTVVIIPAAAHGPLTLEQCITMALQSNLRIEAAAERLVEMDAAIDEATAARMPRLSAQASYTRLIPQPSVSVPIAADLSPFQGPIQDGTFGQLPPNLLMAPLIRRDFQASGNIYNIGVTATQVLYTGGRITNARRIAETARTASEWQKRSAVREIRRDVTKAYYQALAANKGVVALDSAIALMEVVLRDLSNAVEVGIRGEHELLQAQVQIANQRLARQQAATGAQMAHDFLATLIGVPVNTSITLVNDLYAPDAFVVHDLAMLQTRARGASTDMRALEEQMRILETSLLITGATNVPTIAAAAGYSGQGMGGWWTKHKFDWTNSGTISLVAQWDIFDGGSVDQRRRQTLSQKRQLELTMETLNLNLDMLVKNNRAALEDAFASLETNRKNIEQTKRSYEISYDKFQEGMMLSSEVLNAQNMTLQAEIAYYAALSNFYARLADLDYLVNEE
jgi:outer membrane protein TolC